MLSNRLKHPRMFLMGLLCVISATSCVKETHETDLSCNSRVQTLDATGISTDKAKLNATFVLSSISGTTLREAGFYISEVADGRASEWTRYEAGVEGRSLYSDIIGLKPYTTYVYRAYIRTSTENSIVEGEKIEFTTGKLKSAVPYIDQAYDTDSEISGEGIAGSEITITWPTGGQTSARVEPDGKWYSRVPDPLSEGKVIKAIQTEPDKYPSDEAECEVLALVREKSRVPEIDPVYEGAEIISGKGIADSEVTVTFPSGTVMTTTVAGDGTWVVVCHESLTEGDQITALQTELGKLPSDESYTTVLRMVLEISEKPFIDPIYERDDEVTGRGIAGSTVTVIFPSGVEVTVLVAHDDTWSAPCYETLVIGQEVYAYQIEREKERSETASTIVKERYVVEKSAMPEIGVVNAGAMIVDGKGIPGAEVVVIFPSGAERTSTVDNRNIWAVMAPETLRAEDKIYAYQIEPGKDRSETASAEVRGGAR